MPLSFCTQTPAGNNWEGPLLGQHIHRTAVAVVETGGRLSA